MRSALYLKAPVFCQGKGLWGGLEKELLTTGMTTCQLICKPVSEACECEASGKASEERGSEASIQEEGSELRPHSKGSCDWSEVWGRNEAGVRMCVWEAAREVQSGPENVMRMATLHNKNTGY